jgi:hypothetical protein
MDKLREARFFFDKMIVQERQAFGDREPFDFYLSAFLSAAKSVDYRLRHQHKTTYPAWRKKWDAKLTAEQRRLIKFMVDDRNLEVHESGSGRGVKDEKVRLPGGTYSDGFGTVTMSGPPMVLGYGPHESHVIKRAYYFTIDKVERKATAVCGEYLLLLERMVAEFP